MRQPMCIAADGSASSTGLHHRLDPAGHQPAGSLLGAGQHRERCPLHIEGPFCTSAVCCNDAVFNTFNRNGRVKIGTMSKNWSGMLREAFTDIDNFTVTFPIDLNVRLKAMLLAALFLIDFIFLESIASGPGVPDLPGNLIN
ncbi:hypothetical protein MTO96_005006 [Rhipicephalus appendiculatus]